MQLQQHIAQLSETERDTDFRCLYIFASLGVCQPIVLNYISHQKCCQMKFLHLRSKKKKNRPTPWCLAFEFRGALLRKRRAISQYCHPWKKGLFTSPRSQLAELGSKTSCRTNKEQPERSRQADVLPGLWHVWAAYRAGRREEKEKMSHVCSP